MESEDLFLSFLPAASASRSATRGTSAPARRPRRSCENRLQNLDIGTRVVFATDDPKRELLEQILASVSPAVRGAPDPLNRCARAAVQARRRAPRRSRRVEAALERIAAVASPSSQLTPDVSFLRVRIDGSGENDLVYSLIHNEAHFNVAFMFDEENRRTSPPTR